MIADEVSWKDLEVHTREAIWVCVECKMVHVPCTAGGIDYHLEFAARELRISGVPTIRKLCLRTSDYFVATDQSYLTNAIRGRIMATESWDDFVEVYKRD
jgi:hypothetical protein